MDVRSIQREFESGLNELDPDGSLGLAAILACAEVIRRVRALTSENAAETKAALEKLKVELEPLDDAIASGRFKAALPSATGRVLDMLTATLAGLDG